METDQVLIDLKAIRTQVEEAVLHHEECMKTLYDAFSKLTRLQVPDEVSPFQKAHAEQYRGLAIQELAFAVSSNSADPLRGKLKEIPQYISHIMTMLLGGTTKSSEPPVYKGQKSAK